MNLTDLQLELRTIEERLSVLQVEIQKMKPQSEEKKKSIFESITKIAALYPLENKQLPNEMASTGNIYIRSLSYITLTDENNLQDKLLYLCRLSNGMKLNLTSEDILTMGMEIDRASFDRMCSELKDLRYSFLTDALILANITGTATDDILSLLSDIAEMMKCDKEELCVIAFVAKAVLTDHYDVLLQLPAPSKNCWAGQFRQHIPVSWIKKQRRYCGKYCTGVDYKKAGTSGLYRDSFLFNPITPSVTVKKRLPAGSIVKKGDILVSYIDSEGKGNKIISPCNGIGFFVEGTEKNSSNTQIKTYVFVYVVSYFDRYTEFCQWHKNKT